MECKFCYLFKYFIRQRTYVAYYGMALTLYLNILNFSCFPLLVTFEISNDTKLQNLYFHVRCSFHYFLFFNPWFISVFCFFPFTFCLCGVGSAPHSRWFSFFVCALVDCKMLTLRSFVFSNQ